MEDKEKTVLGCLIMVGWVLAIVLVFLAPLPTILALNTLFHLGIGYHWNTYFAMLFINSLLANKIVYKPKNDDGYCSLVEKTVLDDSLRISPKHPKNGE